MKTLQVKQYHQQVAKKKETIALAIWREQGGENRPYPLKSMFYFMREDSKGYPTTERKKGFVVFDKVKAVFGMNRNIAIKRFNQ